VLHEAGYSYQRTSSWVHTGYALRKRQSGTVTVDDLETPEKNRQGKGHVEGAAAQRSSSEVR
jgi:hypothetical protein